MSQCAYFPYLEWCLTFSSLRPLVNSYASYVTADHLQFPPSLKQNKKFEKVTDELSIKTCRNYLSTLYSQFQSFLFSLCFLSPCCTRTQKAYFCVVLFLFCIFDLFCFVQFFFFIKKQGWTRANESTIKLYRLNRN